MLEGRGRAVATRDSVLGKRPSHSSAGDWPGTQRVSDIVGSAYRC